MKTRVNKSTGNESQPDSCFCWYRQDKLIVTVEVCGRMHSLMDHRLIRVKYHLKGVIPKRRQYYEFERVVRNSDIDIKDVRTKLNGHLNEWYNKHAYRVFRNIDRKMDEWIEWDEEVNIKTSGSLYNALAIPILCF